MSDVAIKFENISKQYRLGRIGTGTLSHDLKRWFAINVRGKEDPYLKIGQENILSSFPEELPNSTHTLDYIWALQKINFEVKQGEVLGIIGKNGAGKSTLLKILSRVTTPSTGRILAHGRIASLLEVGTGFHPEMTGRENIFMNGSIMGMTKSEIIRKFDEIVDFAGVGKYIDTPVKRYSSGMTVRLGFAIAAHLEPEILVVDEVLAVGDAEFQKKALGKMQDVSRNDGRTVLFVSHNMNMIQKLCSKAIHLVNGGISDEGEVKEVVNFYLAQKNNVESEFYLKDFRRSVIDYGKTIKFLSIKILNSKEEKTNSLLFGEPFKIELSIYSYILYNDIQVSIRIDSINDISITSLVSGDVNMFFHFKENEVKSIEINCKDILLIPGRYNFTIALKSANYALDRLEGISGFEVLESTHKNTIPHNGTWGLIQFYPKWRIIN